MELAICRKCKHETTEYFPRGNGYYAICKPCYRLYMREYAAKRKKKKIKIDVYMVKEPKEDERCSHCKKPARFLFGDGDIGVYSCGNKKCNKMANDRLWLLLMKKY